MPTKRRHKLKLAADPLVAVQGERIGVALEAAGFTRRGAALALRERGVNVTPATLDFVVEGKGAKGRQGKVRRSLLRGIAELTNLPAEWLCGEQPLLDFVWRSPPGPLAPPEATAKSPAAELANYRFNREWYHALRRELRRECASAEEAAAAWEHIALTVVEAFQRLVSPDYWMRCLLAGDDPAALLTAAEWERAEIHITEAFRVMLAPWFKGQTALPREHLVDVVTLLEKRTRKEN